MTKYSGHEWIESAFKVKCSPFGAKVADLIGALFKGIYHVSDECQKVDWTCPSMIEFKFQRHFWLATWDSNTLTELVILAHDRCMRVEIFARMPAQLIVRFHPRQRTGAYSERHPTMEEAVDMIRKHHGIE